MAFDVVDSSPTERVVCNAVGPLWSLVSRYQTDIKWMSVRVRPVNSGLFVMVFVFYNACFCCISPQVNNCVFGSKIAHWINALVVW